jgi:hypothetical protein
MEGVGKVILSLLQESANLLVSPRVGTTFARSVPARNRASVLKDDDEMVKRFSPLPDWRCLLSRMLRALPDKRTSMLTPRLGIACGSA